MHDWVLLNNKIIDKSEAGFPAVSNAGLYGIGVFTTIAIIDGLPFLFDKHWNRLQQNAAALNIPFGGNRKEDLFSNVLDLIDRNAFHEGKCRITLFDESVPGMWGGGQQIEPSLLIQTGDRIVKPGSLSLKVSFVPVISASPLNNVKSCNYLERLMVFETALKSGFDEAVRTNEKGEVVSASMANIFWVRDEKIYTPSLETGCLEGTTRRHVLDQTDIFEQRTGPGTLKEADHVFLTSAGIGAVGVSQISFGTEDVRYDDLTENFFVENGIEKLRFVSSNSSAA